MPNPIDGPAPVLRPGARCESRGYGVGPDGGVWNCGAQPGHGGRVHVVFRSATREPEVWFSWPTAEATDAGELPDSECSEFDPFAPEPVAGPLCDKEGIATIDELAAWASERGLAFRALGFGHGLLISETVSVGFREAQPRVVVEWGDGCRADFARGLPLGLLTYFLAGLLPEKTSRWDALKSDIATRIDQDYATARSFPAGSETAAAHFSLVSANRTTLAKMRELEES